MTDPIKAVAEGAFKLGQRQVAEILEDLIAAIRAECMPQCQCDYALMVNEAEQRLREVQGE